VPGQVLITGHTDSVPIRSARFPSNWHLSQERAKSVLQLLGDTVAPARLSAEGRADSEPVAPNDTKENKARNRRVEITLYPARQAS
jgi:type VI secretion system protein ImpK